MGGDVRDDCAETEQNLRTEQASVELTAEVDDAERDLGRAESEADLLALLYGGVVVGAASVIVRPDRRHRRPSRRGPV